MTTNSEHCAAVQSGDTTACGKCSLTWDTNDPSPPRCAPDFETVIEGGKWGCTYVGIRCPKCRSGPFTPINDLKRTVCPFCGYTKEYPPITLIEIRGSFVKLQWTTPEKP